MTRSRCVISARTKRLRTHSKRQRQPTRRPKRKRRQKNARDQALWARFFNPLAAEPFLALARVAEREGRVLRAEREYIRAVELQPENPELWYTLGLFQFDVRDNMCAAYRYLNEAYTLDPVGNQWVDDGPLDVARDAVDAGGCALGS